MVKKAIIVFTIFFLLIIFINLVSSLELKVNKPESDTTTNERYPLVNLSANQSAFFYYTIVDKDLTISSRWRKICPSISIQCIKPIKLREGNQTFLFKAENDFEVSQIENRNITLDTKKPIIHRILPRKQYSNKSVIFSVNYSEENLEQVSFYYGTENNILKNIKNNLKCEAGKWKKCNFNYTELNLTSFEGKLISFWFEIADKTGNIITSTPLKTTIDTTNPQILNVNILTNNERARIIVDVFDTNFKQLLFTNTNNCRSKQDTTQKFVCPALQNNRCIIERSFCNGNHALYIIAEDRAGNNATTMTSFFIE